jgi:hypothetical protein
MTRKQGTLIHASSDTLILRRHYLCLFALNSIRSSSIGAPRPLEKRTFLLCTNRTFSLCSYTSVPLR